MLVRSLFKDGVFDRFCGTYKSAGNVIACECSVMQAVTGQLRLNFGGQAFDLETSFLFKRVPSQSGADLCVLQVQENSIASADPLDVLGSLLEARGGQAASTSQLTATPGDSAAPERQAPNSMTMRRLDAANGLGNSMDDMWVLGGVWLERFVVVLDFEHARIGMAEPLQLRYTKKQPVDQSVTPMASTSIPSTENFFGIHWQTCLISMVLVCVVSYAVSAFRKFRRRKSTMPLPGDNALEWGQEDPCTDDIDVARE